MPPEKIGLGCQFCPLFAKKWWALKVLLLRMEGILRKLQKVMKLSQKCKDFENNVTT
jgi:hypothetical protein